MSANLKGMGGIKGLALQHGEKVGIALIGLLALYFVYKSLGLPKLEDRYQATDLQQAISQTNNLVQQTEWPSDDSELASEVRKVKPLAKSAKLEVEPEAYAISPRGFNPAPLPPALRRTDPLLLGAVDVEATGHTGLFAFVDEQIRKAQELRRAREEEQRAREQQRQMERQQQEQGNQLEGGRRRGRGRGGEELGFGQEMVDPDHPNRRMIEGMTRPAGIQLQGGERIERAYWVTVVAKVPIREQLKLYQDAFQNARGYDPARDFPQYLGYFVERTEVERGQAADWKPVYVYDAQQKNIRANKYIERAVTQDAVTKLMESAAENWAGQAIEPVDPRYLNPLLALPLPPLVGRDFGYDATHPDIPLAVDAVPEEMMQPVAEQQQPAQEAPERDERAMFGSSIPGMQPMIGARPGIGGHGAMRSLPGLGRGGLGEFGGRISPMREFGGPGQMMGPGMVGGTQTMLPYGVDHYLLRFFDYTVEPGKKYKYRVRLVLADPNFGVDDRALDASVLDRLAGRKPTATTLVSPRFVDEWSDPSPTVGVPIVGDVKVAEAKLPNPRLYNDEPTITLMVETFDVDPKEGTAVHIAHEDQFRRGYVVNLNEEMKYIGDGGRWIDEYDSYKLHTGVTVLDVEGATPLNRDMTAPTSVLLMDPSGELYIRSELEDGDSVKYLRDLFSEERQSDRGFGPEGGFFPGARGRGPL